MVTTIVGMVVAVVSAVFGISAHGMAAGTATALPGSGQLLMVLGASAGIGAATASLARQHSPVLLSGAGLLAGQGVVHLVLISGHAHGAASSHPAGHAAGHTVGSAAIRAAMDSASGAAGAGGPGAGSHVDALLTPGMLGAHLGAILLTLTVVAVLSATLSWLAARLAPLAASVHLVVVELISPHGRVAAPDARYLLVGGGTRAPPLTV